MASLSSVLQKIAVKTKSRGGFGTELALAARRLLNMKNEVVFNPDHDVSGINGAVLKQAPAIILTDIVTGVKQAVVLKNGALTLVVTSIMLFFSLLCALSQAQAATGDVTVQEIVMNSGTAPILITGSTQATGTLTLNIQPTIGNTITVGTQTYTYSGTLSGTTPAQILISGSLPGTIANTIACINAATGTAAGYVSTGTNTSVTSGTTAGNNVLFTSIASGTAGNAIATTGSFAVPSSDFMSGATLTGGATASGTNLIVTFPAQSGTFLFTGADVVALSGTLTGTAPTVSFQSGTGTVVSGTVSLSGTTAGNATHISPATAPLPLVLTGTTATSPLQMKVANTGTATAPFKGKVFIKGFWLP